MEGPHILDNSKAWLMSFLLIVCFTSYLVFSIAVFPHSPGVVYYHLLLRQETRIPGVAPFSFRIGIWDHFCAKGREMQYTHSLWEVGDHSRSKMHYTCLITVHDNHRVQKYACEISLQKTKLHTHTHTHT